MTKFASRSLSGLLPSRLRSASALLIAAGLIAGTAALATETRIFLIENSDGYGIDTCLANGEPCGAEVANAWCRTHDYTAALDFGRIAVTGSTGITTISGGDAEKRAQACTGDRCQPVVAIACTR
ncbi:hypothetical protein GCM10007301_35630 [Azorhizobium oxalatiphilum]|uniref:DUF4189 domain-containing protein n=1 Tax=Azorhizobium oxalatiphilum TaxID=980631 RepID=A0A917C6J7_9HYPH|nr:hypothetical protein [Azorhizobium oxalatiphilum]GGF72677.1 hypothetical protein GCM10007301_35630 [Azorhizobium oxalatiphilum]